MAESYWNKPLNRRAALSIGALGGISFSLADYLRSASAGALAPKRKAESAIFIFLEGGPSHIDMFDMKPEAPDEIRGEFRPIDTNVPGIQICEHMPKLAQMCDQFTVLRGVSHNLAAHTLGQEYVASGNRPAGQSNFPGIGALVSKYRGTGNADMPPFFAIPRTVQTGGYLGLAYSPLSTQSAPSAGRPFTLRGISLDKGQTVEDFQRRDALRHQLDQGFGTAGLDDPLLRGLNEFSEKAARVIVSNETREALDLRREPASRVASFGTSSFGMSCLTAVRLVARGVRFVTIGHKDWDTHANNFINLKKFLLPQLDVGLSGLLKALREQGLLETTTVVVTGEFGRTPKTASGGRNHYPHAMFVLMAGGGIPGGRVLGKTDSKASEPVDFECSPSDVAASLLHSLGIDHQIEYQTDTGRPVKLVADAHVIPGLFA